MWSVYHIPIPTAQLDWICRSNSHENIHRQSSSSFTSTLMARKEKTHTLQFFLNIYTFVCIYLFSSVVFFKTTQCTLWLLIPHSCWILCVLLGIMAISRIVDSPCSDQGLLHYCASSLLLLFLEQQFASSQSVDTRFFISEASQTTRPDIIPPRLEAALDKGVGRINKCRCEKSHPVLSYIYFQQQIRNSNAERMFFHFPQCSWSRCKRHALPSMGMMGELHTRNRVRIQDERLERSI